VPLRIEDYAVIGDLHTMALVGSDGSIDWLCLPHFDSGALFARLLGTEENGYWKLAPSGAPGTVTATRRRYRDTTLVLETEMETAAGCVRILDCMPIREGHPQVVRVVEGVHGAVDVRMDLRIRFDYGRSIPWVTQHDHRLIATAGPNAVSLWTRVETRGEHLSTVADFTVREGERITFSLAWFPSHEDPPHPIDANYALAATEHWWQTWSAACSYAGTYRDAVLRSLITLKALTYEPTGGIVAAATTSLPEALGGERNWDYRYCWLRDATLTLESLMRGGYHAEAMAWRDWLLRATAGDLSKLQIMYGANGARRLDEWEVDWLAGYDGSKPVRVGNAAAGQFQLDVYGEVMSALYTASLADGVHTRAIWDLQSKLTTFLEDGWKQPDDGIWEVRGPRRHFTHSKVMAWVAVDRAVKTMEDWPDLAGPLPKWRALRDEIHKEICEKGFDTNKHAFTQYYGSDGLDASLLMVPLVGFLPASDARVVGTVEAIERELVEDGFVLRYRTDDSGGVDGLTGREGAFLACSFWLADCLHMIGRKRDATAMFERLLALRNDVGLLSEEYDQVARRLVGNFPQAFSHVSLVNTAVRLSGADAATAVEVPASNRWQRHRGPTLRSPTGSASRWHAGTLARRHTAANGRPARGSSGAGKGTTRRRRDAEGASDGTAGGGGGSSNS
jgi:GH15 family glucan-1,4-alpha-glucosidase